MVFFLISRYREALIDKRAKSYYVSHTCKYFYVERNEMPLFINGDYADAKKSENMEIGKGLLPYAKF